MCNKTKSTGYPMEKALVVLMKNCLPNPENAKTLNDVLSEESLEAILTIIHKGYDDKNHGILCCRATKKAGKHHLEMALERICAFHANHLGKTVDVLPKISSVIKNPEENFSETNLLLLLLFSCATQCYERLFFFEKITSLDMRNFFRVISHLQTLRSYVVPKKVKARGASTLFPKFNFGYGKSSLSASLYNFNGQNNNHIYGGSWDQKNSFECYGQCPFAQLYQTRIQRDEAKLLEKDRVISELRAEIESLKKEREDSSNKEAEAGSSKEKSGSNESKKNETLTVQNGDDMPVLKEAELLYKVETFRKLLMDISEEWAQEKAKLKKMEEAQLLQQSKFEEMHQRSETLLRMTDFSSTKVTQLIGFFEKKRQTRRSTSLMQDFDHSCANNGECTQSQRSINSVGYKETDI